MLRSVPAPGAVSARSTSLASAGLGEIAQLVEHTTENRGVPGSSPGLAITLRVLHASFGRGVLGLVLALRAKTSGGGTATRARGRDALKVSRCAHQQGVHFPSVPT